MNYETEYVFHLFSCGARGLKPEPPRQNVDWEKIISLAGEQSVTYTVGVAIKKSDIGCPESIKTRLTSSVIGASLKNISKISGILEILKKAENRGIHTTVLKGISVAKYYKNPECRVSSDVDLLVSKKDEKAFLKMLSDEGFSVKPRTSENYHSVCTHPKFGMIEVHISLWENGIEDVIFKDCDIKNLPFSDVQAEYGDLTYYELSTDTNLYFLTEHLLKHFVFGGVSIRMIMDNALFIKNNINNIDKEKYTELLKKTGYFYTMQVIYGFAAKYFGFSKEDFPFEISENEDDINMLADDLESGGWQGQNNEKDRTEALYFYRNNYTLKESGKRRHIVSILLGNLRSLLHGIFLPADELQKKYPVLKKHKYLYVFCIIHRIFSRGYSVLKNKSFKNRELIFNEENLSTDALKRVEMFRKFGLMK